MRRLLWKQASDLLQFATPQTAKTIENPQFFPGFFSRIYGEKNKEGGGEEGKGV